MPRNKEDALMQEKSGGSALVCARVLLLIINCIFNYVRNCMILHFIYTEIINLKKKLREIGVFFVINLSRIIYSKIEVF